eukprot:TRINITY_DN18811_c0_g1_i1.p1 TRINITY_DN18811_c0_g1~~TRINITY_DN18811_c0_g1_i1.p1  ORF type:complete len:510 (+),score=155.20 TRINITY_DN18811_c0_g1_i1:76-1605(+)
MSGKKRKSSDNSQNNGGDSPPPSQKKKKGSLDNSRNALNSSNPSPLGPSTSPRESGGGGGGGKGKKRSRSPYKCNKCGKLKKGHICTQPKVPKMLEAKAPMPVSLPVVQDQSLMNNGGGDYNIEGSSQNSLGYSSQGMNEEFQSFTPSMFGESFSYSNSTNAGPPGVHMGSGYGFTNTQTNNFPNVMSFDEMSINDPFYASLTNSGSQSGFEAMGGLPLDKGKVGFCISWFEMAKNGITMLETWLATQKPEWDILGDVLTQIDIDKRKYEDWKNRFQDDVLRRILLNPNLQNTLQQSMMMNSALNSSSNNLTGLNNNVMNMNNTGRKEDEEESQGNINNINNINNNNNMQGVLEPGMSQDNSQTDAFLTSENRNNNGVSNNGMNNNNTALREHNSSLPIKRRRLSYPDAHGDHVNNENNNNNMGGNVSGDGQVDINDQRIGENLNGAGVEVNNNGGEVDNGSVNNSVEGGNNNSEGNEGAGQSVVAIPNFAEIHDESEAGGVQIKSEAE